MTLDEAIKHCKDKAEELRKDADYLDAPYGMDTSARTDCLECANEHEQLAEWLEDYKRLLGEKSYAMGYQDGVEDGLNGIRPQGKWELHGKTYYCSECGEEAIDLEPEPDVYSSSYCLTDYCPYCGADMRKGGAE